MNSNKMSRRIVNLITSRGVIVLRVRSRLGFTININNKKNIYKETWGVLSTKYTHTHTKSGVEPQKLYFIYYIFGT